MTIRHNAMTTHIHGVTVVGCGVDHETRCKHYHGPHDIIAIRFPCCNTYYPCYECHQEASDHLAEKWNKSKRDEKAVLCGACGHQMTINEYMQSQFTCPACCAKFNPGCQNHYHLYFD